MNRWMWIAFAVALCAELRAESPLASPLIEPVGEARRLELTPQLSVISLATFGLPNPGHQVNYVPAIEGLPAFHLILGRPVVDLGRFRLALQLSAGYGLRNSAYPVYLLDSDAPPKNESISLGWVPLSLSTRLQYRIPTLGIRPSLLIGVGALAIFQGSSNPSLNQNWVVPFYSVSPQISFLDSTGFHWLGGFTFGATLIRGLSNTASLSALSLDLGINILL